MAKEFKLPDLGEGIHEAQVVNVMVKEGDSVNEDQMVMEVETDKAAVELPVPFAGTIAKLNVKRGDTIKVGSVLMVVELAGAAEGSPRRPAAPTSASKPAAAVAPPPEPMRREPEPAPAPRAAPEESRVLQPAARHAEAPRHAEGPVPAAPAVRRQAREAGVDLHDVHGTGPGGRVVREDLERYQLAGPTGKGTTPARTAPPPPQHAPAQRAAAPAAPAESPYTTSAPSRPAAPPPVEPVAQKAAVPTAAEALPDFTQWGPVRREQIPQIRRAIARQMVRSVSTIPHVTHGDEADVTDLESFRKDQAAIFADKGAKLTLTAFVMKAVAGALRQFPQFNASFDEAAGEMVFKDYVSIGMAVDSPRGLVVPVLRDPDRKGLITISQEMRALGERAREFKLDIADMRGGTFTITNVGALGGTMATPIINWPEVAILGMGKLDWKPVVRDGQIVPRKMLPLFLSFDHRVIDGADGARFTRAVIAYLESPLNLLLVS